MGLFYSQKTCFVHNFHENLILMKTTIVRIKNHLTDTVHFYLEKLNLHQLIFAHNRIVEMPVITRLRKGNVPQWLFSLFFAQNFNKKRKNLDKNAENFQNVLIIIKILRI